MMDLNEYQYRAQRTAMYPDKGGMGGLTYTVLGLASEAGELAGKLKKILRDHQGEMTPAHREAMGAEVGDCLWYVAMVADELGYTLNQIGERNIDKLRDRKERNVITGSGDGR